MCLLQPLVSATLYMLSRWWLLLFGAFHQQSLGALGNLPRVYMAYHVELFEHMHSLVYNPRQGAGTSHQGCQCHSSNGAFIQLQR